MLCLSSRGFISLRSVSILQKHRKITTAINGSKTEKVNFSTMGSHLLANIGQFCHCILSAFLMLFTDSPIQKCDFLRIVLIECVYNLKCVALFRIISQVLHFVINNGTVFSVYLQQQLEQTCSTSICSQDSFSQWKE